ANESSQTITVTSVGTASHGTVSLVSGTVTYTPTANYFGTDTFTYTITDNGTTNGNPDHKSTTAKGTRQETSVNQPPTADTQSKTVAEDGTLTFPSSILLVGDTPGPANESSQTITVTAVGTASHGTVSLVSGTVTYTPAANYNGPDQFTYTITDNGTSNGQS